MSEEEETSEGYYSDASFSSSVAVSVTGQNRAELGEEDYDVDQSYTISFHEGVVPMEVEDEEQIEDDDSDDGCIRSPVRDRWTATQSQEQVDELLGDCDQDDCQSDSEGYTSTRTKSPMEDEEETATVHCIPTSQTSAAHGLLGWLVHKKDDLLDDLFPARSRPSLPVAQTPAKNNLPYVSTPSSATNVSAVKKVKREGPTDYDPASHRRLAKMNKRLRRKLQTKQRQLKAKDAKIAEVTRLPINRSGRQLKKFSSVVGTGQRTGQASVRLSTVHCEGEIFIILSWPQVINEPLAEKDRGGSGSGDRAKRSRNYAEGRGIAQSLWFFGSPAAL